ncbi:PREDICTED: probable FBD-associated F-box protein At1g32375 [Camelina sativa]|uniref:Probable FBD-associated F-box protein At1g32375 n=1 Tax=Camelina sativa TaxID=90675 RepID=A0ABM1QNK0_CAMSA|nr:PREDICTED: probable FBD-associated F-box protein At1g32375 [Camelina sativa]
MDRISELPDELLWRILSLLPATDVVTTMVFSKRWQHVWMMVPKLVYDDSYKNHSYERFSQFVDRSLFLHEAPFIETLHFKLGKTCGAGDIRVWTRAVEKCCVHELIIDIDCSSSTTPVNILPRCFYTRCQMLVTLKLKSVILVDFSSPVTFPSLKTLSLHSVEYPGEIFLDSFFFNCPALEDLVVEKCPNDNVEIFFITVPSLKRLVLRFYDIDESHLFVISAPSLEFLDIVDRSCGSISVVVNMPKIVKATIDVTSVYYPSEVLASITSVKHLDLLTSKYPYPVGSIFGCLVRLKLCTCEAKWLNLLMCLLRDSPKLQSLKLGKVSTYSKHQPRPCWNEPSSVPECLLSSLSTLEWVKYQGTEAEKEVAAFILRNANCLKKATISSNYTDPNMKLNMLKELSSSPRRSPICQLIFN